MYLIFMSNSEIEYVITGHCDENTSIESELEVKDGDNLTDNEIYDLRDYHNPNIYDLTLNIVKRKAFALRFNYVIQTEKICLAAVNKNGLALQYVQEQTPKICLAAVNKNGLFLKYVQEQTPDICLAAVKNNGLALQYVRKQNLDIIDEALKNNSNSRNFINWNDFKN